MIRSLPALALTLLAALPVACGGAPAEHGAAAAAHPPFVALSYAEALAQAEADDRLVVLDFTASWCPPCREMEKSTWPDADVQAWVAREAVAIQVDVDEQGDLAGKFRVANIPTIVFLEPSGKELGRFVGGRDPAGFLAEAAKHVD